MDKILKIGFGMLAALALLFGFVRIGQSLKLTFNNEGATSATADQQEDDALAEAKLRVRDTDGDGLTDWDELNAHGTSPYLADSDSDGVADAEEISKGQDPNCPIGRECGSGDLQSPTLPVDLSAGLSPVASAKGEEADSLGALDEATSGILSSLESGAAPTAGDIRALLKQAGVTDAELEGVSDEDLLKLFEEIASQELEAE